MSTPQGDSTPVESVSDSPAESLDSTIAEPIEGSDSINSESSDSSDEDLDISKTPYHKIPRFRELNEKYKSEKQEKLKISEENAQLKAQLEAFQKQEPTEAPKVEQKNSSSDNTDQEYDSLFTDAPEYTFLDKNGEQYESLPDFAKDFEKQFMARLLHVQNSAKTKVEREQSEITSKLDKIQSELGEDFTSFQDYVDELSQDLTEDEQSKLSMDILYKAFKRAHNLEKQMEQTPKPARKPSKINGSSAMSSSGDSVGTYSPDQISSSGFITNELLRNA